MEITKYTYSLYQNLFAMLFLYLPMMFFLILMIVTNSYDHQAWLMVGFSFLFGSLMIAYLCKKFFFPYLRGEIALELDDARLQFFISNKIIYWKDVNYINGYPIKSGGYSIEFNITDSDDIKISTKFVKGDDQEIYDTIYKYFKACKK